MAKKDQLKYEKPELKTLFNDLETAMGACAAGISDTAACTGGAGAKGTCSGGSMF